MLCRATQDRQIKLKSSDKMQSPGGGNGKPFQYSCGLGKDMIYHLHNYNIKL